MSAEAEADASLLGLANEKGKFAIQIGMAMDDALIDAFERGIDREWFTLVDVTPIAIAPGTVCRVFRLTQAGWKRRHAVLPWIKVKTPC